MPFERPVAKTLAASFSIISGKLNKIKEMGLSF